MLKDLMEQMCLSVTQLNDYVAGLFQRDEALNGLLIAGEVSSFRPNASGHLYFTLKDENAAVRCVMFRSYAAGIGFKLENGMKVRCFGSVTLYKKDGQYQLNLRSMEKIDDRGELYQRYLEIKERLEQEGLFNPSKKRPLPQYPRRIGVVTSPTGAVIRDIITVSRRRNPGVDILLYPAKVQGAGSAQEIIRGIQWLNERDGVDVLIVGRGGGSMEDLFEFNDEALARTIRASKIPVVSAVGHETDFTIADFAADVRAATPSAAAELCSPDMAAILRMVLMEMNKARRLVSGRLEEMSRRTDALTRSAAMHRSESLLSEYTQRMDYAQRSLGKDTLTVLSRASAQVDSLIKRLSGLSPQEVLSRGYAAILDEAQQPILSAKEVTMGQSAKVVFADGRAEAMFTGSILKN